jgi:hypothetical protein
MLSEFNSICSWIFSLLTDYRYPPIFFRDHAPYFLRVDSTPQFLETSIGSAFRRRSSITAAAAAFIYIDAVDCMIPLQAAIRYHRSSYLQAPIDRVHWRKRRQRDSTDQRSSGTVTDSFWDETSFNLSSHSETEPVREASVSNGCVCSMSISSFDYVTEDQLCAVELCIHCHWHSSG